MLSAHLWWSCKSLSIAQIRCRPTNLRAYTRGLLLGLFTRLFSRFARYRHSVTILMYSQLRLEPLIVDGYLVARRKHTLLLSWDMIGLDQYHVSVVSPMLDIWEYRYRQWSSNNNHAADARLNWIVPLKILKCRSSLSLWRVIFFLELFLQPKRRVLQRF